MVWPSAGYLLSQGGPSLDCTGCIDQLMSRLAEFQGLPVREKLRHNSYYDTVNFHSEGESRPANELRNPYYEAVGLQNRFGRLVLLGQLLTQLGEGQGVQAAIGTAQFH